ncbi:hypothetical protein [Natronospora cellulosivora (SeqCode)]
MGKNYIYQCKECSEKYETSGPWAFYWDKNGTRIPYGYPGPYSKKAELNGIDGTFADLLCLKCGREVNVILDQYNEPMKKLSLGLMLFLGRNKKDEEKNRCPYCKSEDLFLSFTKDESKDVSCPKCHQGSLKIRDQWYPGEE